jgi:hypothetical protein
VNWPAEEVADVPQVTDIERMPPNFTCVAPLN